MRVPTKSELVSENTKLRRELDIAFALLVDIARGRALHQHEEGANWLISRPGSASGGACFTYSRAEGSFTLGTIDEMARNAREWAGRANLTAKEDRPLLAANLVLAGAAEAVVHETYADNRLGPTDLPVDKHGFRVVAFGGVGT